MKIFITALIILFTIEAYPAQASDLWTWTPQDSALASTLIAVDLMDYATTIQCAKHPDGYRERNRTMGEHPSVGAVQRFFPILIASQIAFEVIAPHPYRGYFQLYDIGVEAWAVYGNRKIGLKISF